MSGPTCPLCFEETGDHIEMDEQRHEEAFINDDGYREVRRWATYSCPDCAYVDRV